MATILDPKTGDAWELVDGVWKKVREGTMRTLRPLHRVNGHGDEGVNSPCAHPDCSNTLSGGAWRGARTGKLYCSKQCRAEMSDEPSPEDLARMVH